MPTYVYKFVDTGETIEVQQSFADDTLTEAAHPSSGEMMAVKKVFQPVGVTFKGSGFFKTDNRGSKSGGNGTSSGPSSSGSSSTGASSGGDSDGSSSSTTSTGTSSGESTSTPASSTGPSGSTGSSGSSASTSAD